MPVERDRRSISSESASSTITTPPATATLTTASIDLACLPIGCPVSAKYRGAFCSAQVKSIDKQVKVKVTLLDSGETVTLSDEQIHYSGSLQIGLTVPVCVTLSNPSDLSTVIKSQGKKQALIKKIIDNSIYTVVFNDGDETTLRRASLCLKGIRLYQNHIGQSKTLPNLRPSSPINEINEISSVVCIRRKMKTVSQVFPALVLKRKALPDYLWVKSFVDGKEYVVHRHNDVQSYRNNPEIQALCRLSSKQATQACERFLRYHQFPTVWQKKKQTIDSDHVHFTDEDLIGDLSESEEETTEEKDSFLARLLAFMDDRRTPINTIPQLYNYDLDLHRLFKIVRQLGGSNKVTKNNQWNQVHIKMGLPDVSPSESGRTIEQAYKKYLQPYEDFTKKLGHFNSRTSNNNADVRRSLFNRRSHGGDEIPKLSLSSLKTTSSSSPRKSRPQSEIKRSLSSESDDHSADKKKIVSVPTKSRKRMHSKSTDSFGLTPVIKIAKISSELLDDCSLTETKCSSMDSLRPQPSSSSTSSIDSNERIDLPHSISLPNLSVCLSPLTDDRIRPPNHINDPDTDCEIPSIFQTLLLSTTDDCPRLNYDEISINDILIIRDEEHYVRCLEKDDDKSLLCISFQEWPSKDDQWIDFDRVIKRVDPKSIPHLSVPPQTDTRALHLLSTCSTNSSFFENFLQGQSSISDIQINTSAPIRPHKRRVTRDTPSTKDTPISTKTKFKFQTDSVTNLESNLDQSPSFENKRCRGIGKRTGRRSMSHADNNKNADCYLPFNLQLRQRLEDMFKNRTSRYDFLDLNETIIGDNRLEHLKDRLRQCQKVFFNLHTALTKIDTQRDVFLRTTNDMN